LLWRCRTAASPPSCELFPYTTLFRSKTGVGGTALLEQIGTPQPFDQESNTAQGAIQDETLTLQYFPLKSRREHARKRMNRIRPVTGRFLAFRNSVRRQLNDRAPTEHRCGNSIGVKGAIVAHQHKSCIAELRKRLKDVEHAAILPVSCADLRC